MPRLLICLVEFWPRAIHEPREIAPRLNQITAILASATPTVRSSPLNREIPVAFVLRPKAQGSTKSKSPATERGGAWIPLTDECLWWSALQPVWIGQARDAFALQLLRDEPSINQLATQILG